MQVLTCETQVSCRSRISWKDYAWICVAPAKRSSRAAAGSICYLQKLGSFQLDDSEEEPVNIEANDLYALPYNFINSLVESGQIHLV
ncbi:hypothetical protein HAX54_039894 [Datura stramonium]|uniref:DNA replication complex GINS protein SLD5 C-terminal domain-containing protein n=1 Tax=Datura stramonium TaxID=4076 RepID=A0ABS8SJF9_DATST|nr:hypothetical protein [Datura stramonium]